MELINKLGLNRCGKSCRLRWLNYLRPDIKHGGFTEEEDNAIYTLFCTIGSRLVLTPFSLSLLIRIYFYLNFLVNLMGFFFFFSWTRRWSVIASHLPGRTDNDVKNYWNTKLKKRVGLEGKIATCSTTTSNIFNHGKLSPNHCSDTNSSLILGHHVVYEQQPPVSDFNTNVIISNNNIGNKISLRPTTSSISPHQQQQVVVNSTNCSSYTLGLEKSNLGSWSGIGSTATATLHEDGILMELGFESSNIDLLLNGFGF